jgi:hypothetical protein
MYLYYVITSPINACLNHNDLIADVRQMNVDPYHSEHSRFMRVVASRIRLAQYHNANYTLTCSSDSIIVE